MLLDRSMEVSERHRGGGGKAMHVTRAGTRPCGWVNCVPADVPKTRGMIRTGQGMMRAA